MKQAVILLAHGARDATWAEPFQQVTEELRRQLPEQVVELAFLEFMQPDLLTLGQTLGQTLSQPGGACIYIVPLFLGAGGHVQRDVPVMLAQLQVQFPAIHWVLTPVIGLVPSVIQAMAQGARSLIETHSQKLAREPAE